jgi:hypothetical protein
VPKARVIPLRPGGTLNLPSPLLSLRKKRVQCGGIGTWCRDDHTPVTAAPEIWVLFGARLDTLLYPMLRTASCALCLRVAVDEGTLRYYDEARARCPRALASVAQRQRRCQSSNLNSAFACQRIAHQRLRRNLHAWPIFIVQRVLFRDPSSPLRRGFGLLLSPYFRTSCCARRGRTASDRRGSDLNARSNSSEESRSKRSTIACGRVRKA